VLYLCVISDHYNLNFSLAKMASDAIIVAAINLGILVLINLQHVDCQTLRVGRGIADMTGLVSEGALVRVC
jgi:hypothetical protein